jgi:hypothetical protein
MQNGGGEVGDNLEPLLKKLSVESLFGQMTIFHFLGEFTFLKFVK